LGASHAHDEDDARMHLFKASGECATALSKTSFAALGLRERQHLQEWVIATLR
jgi:hypothetical protein